MYNNWFNPENKSLKFIFCVLRASEGIYQGTYLLAAQVTTGSRALGVILTLSLDSDNFIYLSNIFLWNSIKNHKKALYEFP